MGVHLVGWMESASACSFWAVLVTIALIIPVTVAVALGDFPFS